MSGHGNLNSSFREMMSNKNYEMTGRDTPAISTGGNLKSPSRQDE